MSFLQVDQDSSWADDSFQLTKPKSPEPVMVAPSAAAPPPAAVVVVEEKEKQSVQIPDRPPYSMFVKNLSYDLDRASLKKYFVDAGLHVMEASISGDDKKPHRGYGQVEFRTRDSLEQALNMKNPQIMNRSVWFEVLQKRDVPRGRDESRHRQRSERKVEHGKGAKGKGEERRPPRREESRHVEAPKQEERSWRKPEETKKDDVSPRDQKKDDKRNRARSPRQYRPKVTEKTETKSNDSSAPAPLEKSDSFRKKLDPFGGAKPREENLKKRDSTD